MNKKFLQKTNLGLTVAIVTGILIVFNFFSYQIFYRWDLTENKDYSISKVSKKSAGELDDVINIKAYFSQDLPTQYITLSQEVGDILDEYSNYSNGKIRTEFIDPNSLENPEQELYVLGIPALQFNVLEKDKQQSIKGFLGMIIQYGDKKEVIPVVQNTQNLEYQITMSIKKLTSEEISTIGIVTSHGSASEKELAVARKKLQEIYELKNVDLKELELVPADVDTLLIVGATEEFTIGELGKIDTFVMQGGSLMVMMDGVKVAEGLAANINKTNLEGLLSSYGVKLNNNLILDVYSGMVSFSSGFFTFNSNYPFWPKVLKKNFDQENGVVAKLETLVLPWVSSLDITAEGENKVSYLAKTSPKAWEQTGSFDLNPQQKFAPTSATKQYTLAASIFGKFKSPYEKEQTADSHLIVVGDSDFMRDSFLGQTPDNLVFFQNLVDSLTLDEDLINIRSKSVTYRPIEEELSDGQKMFIRYINVFGVTIVVVAFGLFRYFSRRKNKFVDEL